MASDVESFDIRDALRVCDRFAFVPEPATTVHRWAEKIAARLDGVTKAALHEVPSCPSLPTGCHLVRDRWWVGV